MIKRRAIWIGILTIIVLIVLAACGGGAPSGSSQQAGSSEATIRAQTQDDTTPLIPTVSKTQPAGLFGLPTRPPAEETTVEPTEEATPEATEESAGGGEVMMFEASGDAPEAIYEAYAQARALEPDQAFKVTFTDAQLTAAVNARLAESGASELIQALSIAFVPDEIDITFSISLGESNASIDVTMAMNISVDENGDVQVEVLSAEAGQTEIPPEALDSLNTALANALVGAAGADASDEVDLTITDIVIGEGTATVSGYVTPEG